VISPARGDIGQAQGKKPKGGGCAALRLLYAFSKALWSVLPEKPAAKPFFED